MFDFFVGGISSEFGAVEFGALVILRLDRRIQKLKWLFSLSSVHVLSESLLSTFH